MKQARRVVEDYGVSFCYRVRYLGFMIGGSFTYDDSGRRAADRLRNAFNKALRKEQQGATP